MNGKNNSLFLILIYIKNQYLTNLSLSQVFPIIKFSQNILYAPMNKNIFFELIYLA